jgi:uncharacterized protein YndB with AHSA1/START domain
MGDYAILMQFDVNADRETVHHALSTQEGIRSWWSVRADGPTDGELRVSFPDVPQPFEFSVSGDDSDRIEWVTGGFPPWWADTWIRWDMMDNPDAAGTRLQFRHAGYAPDNPVIPIVTPAWAQIILRLKGYAETGQPQPFFDF